MLREAERCHPAVGPSPAAAAFAYAVGDAAAAPIAPVEAADLARGAREARRALTCGRVVLNEAHAHARAALEACAPHAAKSRPAVEAAALALDAQPAPLGLPAAFEGAAVA